MPSSVATPRAASVAASFADRHIGPSHDEVSAMLKTLGQESLEGLITAAVPESLRRDSPLKLPAPLSEQEALAELKILAGRNKIYRSYIGTGYYDTVTPPVIQRNILENPGWYTAYTPYQAEIAQGRLEALLNFQTMVMDLTGLPVANASLLDEATAAAEAMAMSYHSRQKDTADSYFVSRLCHPQTIAVVRTRAEALGLKIVLADHEDASLGGNYFGALLQYPATDGAVFDYSAFIEGAHRFGVSVALAADPLALTLLKSPGELGADIALGSTQRFGVPMGYGGPHAAYLAARESLKRLMPGRIVGISKDSSGKPALRLSLQTREQHIRRERATSNICTAQVLLAVISSMYAVYHGPEGLTAIARRVRSLALALAEGLRRQGYSLGEDPFFDTVRVEVGAKQKEILAAADSKRINLRVFNEGILTVSLDETTGEKDVRDLLEVFAPGRNAAAPAVAAEKAEFSAPLKRESPFLEHPVFSAHRSETEMLRYIKRLESKDLSLTTSMIPLGSCTMKLNAACEMLPVTWPEFGRLHPFAPLEQAAGYQALFASLEAKLSEITGFAAVSLQPNAGSQGEYAGLLVIRRYHESRGQGRRKVCLIPQSAHGTNPASAALAGFKIVPVSCVEGGDIDIADLKAKAEEHRLDLAALMVTYPSTHGVFEEGIRDIARVVHEHGGLVYMDGANMNALVGLCSPADLGADVCHLNLHKTFCIPHGGGGPGMGPIGVTRELADFLPGHPLVATGGAKGIGAISAAPWGSASILPISWAYAVLMGESGLTRATSTAILNANYAARRLEGHYPILFRGRGGFVAHECILDMRGLKAETGVSAEDVAKRLMDYGFHAPTVSFPVPETMMLEPTESESQAEIDRFCDAMISIREEIREIALGSAGRADNVLKNAPHTALAVSADLWARPYSREKAAYPLSWLKEHKFWPAVGRIDGVYGDRNFFCSCYDIQV